MTAMAGLAHRLRAHSVLDSSNFRLFSAFPDAAVSRPCRVYSASPARLALLGRFETRMNGHPARWQRAMLFELLLKI